MNISFGLLSFAILSGIVFGLIGYFIFSVGPYGVRASRQHFTKSDTIETIKERGNFGFAIGFLAGSIGVWVIHLKNKRK